jgi:hypothetical protein
MTKPEIRIAGVAVRTLFVIRTSEFLRHSSFELRHFPA